MLINYSRRQFIRNYLSAMGSTMLLSGLSQKALSFSRPNIIIIMVDDMGFSDLSCYGSEIATPNLDRLASQGIRFTQFYNCARCSPSRAALLTGCYPHKVGMGDLANLPNPNKPAYQGYLNDRCLTIAEALKNVGYRSLISGKWHLGENRPYWPLDRGFDKYYGLINGVSNYFDPNLVAPGINQVPQIVIDNTRITSFSPNFYLTDAITDNAVAMIQKYSQDNQPFFLYVAHAAPHWPLQAFPEDIEKYRGKFLVGWDTIRQQRYQKTLQAGLIKSQWKLSPRDTRVPAWINAGNKEWEDRRMAVYAAQLERMDRGIGRILDTLTQTGIEQNTLVIFLADNGASAELLNTNTTTIMPGSKDTNMSYGTGWANASNTPFRRYKVDLYEGGISTPLIARWPGVIRAGTITNEVGHIIDLMPTCLQISNAEYPRQIGDKTLVPLDGKSLFSVLQGNPQNERTLYWEHKGNRAIRKGKWKAVYPQEVKKWELYDLDTDRTETKNIAATYPQLIQQMSAEWQTWANLVGV